MSKIRINDLARELEVKSKEILDVADHGGCHGEENALQFSGRSRSGTGAEASPRPLRACAEFGEVSSRAVHGEEEIKTKIDLSNISRPGDVLRAITQQKGVAERSCGAPGSQAAGCDAGARSELRQKPRRRNRGNAAQARRLPRLLLRRPRREW